MALKRPPRVYWDCNVFVSYIEEIAGRFVDIDAVLREAEKGDIELLTSVATITEVAFAAWERLPNGPDAETEQKINSLWVPPSPVKLVEFHQLIAEEARDLIRQALPRGWGLKPYDAIHLSTARRMNVDRLDTYDEPLEKYAGLVNYKIARPPSAPPDLFMASAEGLG